jgi:hypothetical protein
VLLVAQVQQAQVVQLVQLALLDQLDQLELLVQQVRLGLEKPVRSVIRARPAQLVQPRHQVR